MATGAETEAYINSTYGKSGTKVCSITHDYLRDGTYSDYYVTFHTEIQGIAPKSMWARVQTADIVALQYVSIFAAMNQSGNVDPNVGP